MRYSNKQMAYMKITIFWDVMTSGLLDRLQLHCITSEKTVTFIFTAVRTSNLTVITLFTSHLIQWYTAPDVTNVK
jgi:hypothetical protein